MQGLESPRTLAEQCLDCRIEGRRLAVPLAYVDQLVEYERHPLPLARANLGGIGLHEGRILISLSLRASAVRSSSRTAAVLFRGAFGSTAWALEVDETYSFVDVVRGAGLRSQEPWIAAGNLVDGASREWLDVARLISSFTAAQGTT